MFIAALFAIARTWKQPRSPSTDEWIRKLWYVHTMEYHSAIKRNTFESVQMRWMILKAIIERSKSERKKQILYINTHIYMKSRLMVLTILCAGQQRRHRYKEETYGHDRGEGGWD